MTNPFYTASGTPGTGAAGLSALIRTEFLAIQTAFDAMPRITTQGNYDSIFVQAGNFTFNLPAGAGTLALTSDVATEAAARAAADATEATTRAAADTAETTRATTAEGVNATAIAAETTRATAAEGVLTTGIGAEAATRAAAITALATQVVSAKFQIDTTFYLVVSGANPVVTFDTNDYLFYDRGANGFGFTIGGSAIFSLSAAGASVVGAMGVSGSLTAADIAIGAGPSWTSGAGVPGATQPKGSLYSRTGGGVSSTLYVSQGGGTWNAVVGV